MLLRLGIGAVAVGLWALALGAGLLWLLRRGILWAAEHDPETAATLAGLLYELVPRVDEILQWGGVAALLLLALFAWEMGGAVLRWPSVTRVIEREKVRLVRPAPQPPRAPTKSATPRKTRPSPPPG